VVSQYHLGSLGYWDFHVAWYQKLAGILLLVPAWMILAMLGRVLIKSKMTAASPTENSRWFCSPAMVVIAWWFCFNALITYTFDARIIPAAMPLAVVAACVWIVRSWRSGVVMTILAALFFQASLLVVSGSLPPQWATPWLEPQSSVREVGLREVALMMKNTPELRGRRVMIASGDDFVEYAALRVAMRLTPGSAEFEMDSYPWGIDPDVVKTLLKFDYVLHKTKRSRTNLTGKAWASLDAIEALMQDTQSPLKDDFEQVWTAPIHQPDLEDDVVLYRIRKDFSTEVQRKAEAFAQTRLSRP